MLEWKACLNKMNETRLEHISTVGNILADCMDELDKLTAPFIESDAKLESLLINFKTDFGSKYKVLRSGGSLASSTSFVKDTTHLFVLDEYACDSYHDLPLYTYLHGIVSILNSRDMSMLDKLYEDMRNYIYSVVSAECQVDDILLYDVNVGGNSDKTNDLVKYLIHLIIAGYDTRIFPVSESGTSNGLAKFNSIKQTIKAVEQTLLSKSNTFFAETLTYLKHLNDKCFFLPNVIQLNGTIYECDVVEVYDYHSLYDSRVLDDLQRPLYAKVYSEDFVGVEVTSSIYKNRLEYLECINCAPRYDDFNEMYVYRDLAIGVGAVNMLLYNQAQKHIGDEKIHVTYPIDLGDLSLEGSMDVYISQIVSIMRGIEFPLTCKQLLTKIPIGAQVLCNDYDNLYYKSDLRISVTLLDPITAIANKRFDENGFTDRAFSKDLIYNDMFGHTLFERLNNNVHKIKSK